MASPVDAAGEPIPTSAVLMASSKHIAARCRPENVAFLKCKQKDPNPEKCLEKGREVTRCVLSLLKDLHHRCTKEMDAYVGWSDFVYDCDWYNLVDVFKQNRHSAALRSRSRLSGESVASIRVTLPDRPLNEKSNG
ncbi:hypothetical protein NL676_020863 [Syzygium grande]|nr:hypothetical protein NL676_020863 [Syzygium grande]